MSERILTVAALVLAVAALFIAVSLQAQVDTLSARLGEAAEAPQEAAGDGAVQFELADAMGALALRMSNLWFAREVGSMALFDYEVHEVGEVQEEIVSAGLIEAGRDVGAEVDRLVIQKLPALRSALEAGDVAAYETVYKRIVDGCNDCHDATAHPFIRIGIPEGAQVVNRRIRSE